MEKYNERPYYPYSWHQSHDQATVLLMVPYSVQDEDVSVIIDTNHLIIEVRGHCPTVKGKLYGEVDTNSSVWQLEPRSLRTGGRERTTSTASTTSTHSQSSYAFVSSDPDISSSFAASLESGPVSDAEDAYSPSPALSSPNLSFDDAEGLYRLPRRKLNLNPDHSRSVSPGHAQRSMTSSFSSLDSGRSPQSGRLLTVHLEKEQSIIWPSLIVGPVPESLSSSISNTVVVFDANEDEEKYNMDPTSLALIGLELSDIRKDKQVAFEYFLRAWRLAHVPSATIRLVSHYLPLDLLLDFNEKASKPQRGSIAYYLKSVGGTKGLAQLYVEAGLLHLEGAATTLLASSYSSLSSIRIPLQSQLGEGGTEAWKRDREAAVRYFERAKLLYPAIDIPALPSETQIELEMPTMQVESNPESDHSKESIYIGSETDVPVIRRRRRKEDREQLEKANADVDNIENAWYLYVPGLIGAGTALLVVGIVGALSFSTWSRRSQSS